ncbi:hypothetical protein [Mesorhizobium sp. BE184]|uniref:hypothetical protein n=1 Tax=Mesorhizobium sp. BE184 TaxID=2817714 RepID=UPI00286BA749|nr:hypothetical protein [Mesorhizobium sp. BE184]
MNTFLIRYSREGTRYRGEYRLAHWSGCKAVMDDRGTPILFAHPMDAHIAATNEFLKLLNSVPAFTGLMNSDSAKAVAESHFTRKPDGQGEETKPADVRQGRASIDVC